MGVKVTGQFEPAGAFSIVDGKDVSGHITGSNISGSATGTGSFGKILGDGSDITGIASYTVSNSSNNRVLTSVNSSSGNAEANLTFDGSTLGITGNVTGTLTGSFSRGHITDKLGINETNPDTRLEIAGAHISGIGLAHIDSTDHAFIALDAAGAAHNKGIYFQENGVHQSILEHQGTQNRLRIWDGSTTYVTIGDSTGDIHTIGNISANGNISGSSTSTGSFGELHIADRIGVNQTNPASLIHVKAPTTSDDAGITFSSAHPYNWSIGTDAGAGHYFKITNADTPGGGTDYLSFGGNTITFATGVTNVVINSDEISVGNAIRHIDDPDTSIEFTSNQIDFQADDQSMLLTPNFLSGSATNGKGFSGSFNHIIVANKITGSAISTGSFGKLLGDGSDISNLAITALNNQSANRLVTVGATTTELDGESNLTWNGSVLAVGTSSPALNQGLHVKTSFINGVARFESGDAGVSITLKDNAGLANFDYDGSSDTLHIADASYVPRLTISATKISGSALSTGSFGHLRGGVLTSEDGNIKYKAGTQTFQNAAGSKTMAVFNGANSVDLHYNNSKKFETTNTGVTVSGNLIATGDITAQRLIVSSSVTNMTIAEKSGSTIFGDSTDDTHLFTGSVNITGSATATSFIGDGSQLTGLTPAAITTYNNATDNRILTSVNSTTIQGESALTFNGTQLDLSSAGHATVHITGASGKDANLKLQNNSRLWIFQNDGDNTLAKGAGVLHLYDGTAGASRIIVNGSTGLVEVPGGVSGSATSTGSFGRVEAVSRVEAEHIHSTDDISADGRVTSTDAVIGNTITINANGISVGNDTRYIRVGSDSDLELNHRHPQHTSPFRASTNTNIITDKTNSGLLLFGGNPGIIMESPVSSSEGMFLSGSRANLELRGGNISGSATSTGSFGRIETVDSIIPGNYVFNNVDVNKATSVVLGPNAFSSADDTAQEGDNQTLVAIGSGVISAVERTKNSVYIGANVLSGYTGGSTRINSAVVIGKGAGTGMAAASSMTIIGADAGSTTAGANSVIVGYQANAATYGTSIGYQAGGAENNVSIGSFAGAALGHSGVYIGYQAGQNINNTNADQNTFLGGRAGRHDTAGSNLTNTSNAVLVGWDTHATAGSTNEIVIGANASGGGSNTTTIGNSSQTHVIFGGNPIISGSATSTGSFGKLLGDGSEITGLSSFAVANSSNNRVLTSVDSSNGNAEANLTFDGSLLNVVGGVTASAGITAESSVIRAKRGTNYLEFDSNSNGFNYINTPSGKDIRLAPGGGTVMRIQTGKVSIMNAGYAGSEALYVQGNIRSNSTSFFGGVEIGNNVLRPETGNGLVISGVAQLHVSGSNNKVGIGTTSADKKLHIQDGVAGIADLMLLDNTQNSNGYGVGILFGLTGVGQGRKGGIFFERTASTARGSLHFSTHDEANSTNVDVTDASLTITREGNIIVPKGNVSGSATSTGSFGSLKATAHQGDLYIQGSSSTAKLKIRPSINTGISELHFSRYNRDNAGYISYNHTADRMDFYAAGPAQRMYMSYSGVNINQALTVGTSITAGGNISGSATSTGSFGDYRSLNNTIFVDGSSKFFAVGKTAYGSTSTDGAWFKDLAGTNGFVQISVTGVNEVLSLNQNSNASNAGPIIAGKRAGTTKFRVNADGNVTASLGGQFGGLLQGFGVRVTNSGGPELKNATPNATNPTIVPSRGDTNTGIGYGGANGSTADNINLITGGTTGLYIDSSQNVVVPNGNISGSAISTGSFGRIETAGNLEPKVHNTSNLGSESRRWANIYSADLQLSNMDNEEGNEVDGTKGSWTIQEGEDDLYLLNRKNGKKYKFKLEEIT